MLTFIITVLLLLNLIFIIFLRKHKNKTVAVLDVTAVLDSRIIDFIKTNLFDEYILPSFIQKEVERIKGNNKLINKLISNKKVTTVKKDYKKLTDYKFKLLKYAKDNELIIITDDFEINRMSVIRALNFVNLNDLYNSLKPIILPGHTISILISKEGKERNQAIGLLDDGTTVVVEDARKFIGKELPVRITSIMHTSNSKMIFAKI
ncbi:TRAM domain-containing protein [Candidatus Ruminimicrobium bovinum]|uniref:TRAM domain-containing protein n=1 Tax=Candidatus Ruminimicrobium bovinum TaxID=3242779 RepID=UPI0039B9CFBC